MDTRKSKTITNADDIEYLLNIKEEDITLSFIMENFAEFNGEIRFNPYDIITIPPNSYGKEKKKNKNHFTTTVGLWVFNKYFIEKDLFDLFKYINESVGDDIFGSLNDKLSYALMEDKIDVPTLKRYLMKTQKVMPYVSILSPNYTQKMLTCTKVINKKKEELIKKYQKDLDAGNEVIAVQMESELLKFATDYLKDDPSMDMFLSGARGSIGNNFKNMFVMKGVVKDPDPNAKQKYKVATSNYIDGVIPEEYTLFANTLAAGPYMRAKKTAVGGYLEKLFLSAFQHVVLDEPNSDCGTEKYIKVTLDKKNISVWMYSYIIEGSRLIEITSENKDKYIDKTVKMRYSALCKSKTGICNKCMGNMLYRLNIKNVGVAMPKIPSTLKNISMKSFHDSTSKLTEMDINKAFGVK